MEILELKQNEDYYNQFANIAKSLFFEYELVVNDKVYEFCEIEFYFDNKEDHQDPYIHGDLIQNTNGQWYFHGSGIDITLGDKNKSFGGILIRGIKRKESDTFINGPILVAKEIFQQFGSVAFSDINLGLRKRKKPRTLSDDFVASSRINLPSRKETEFLNKPYRFITYIQPQHPFKEKGKVAQAMRLQNPKINLIEKFGYNII